MRENTGGDDTYDAFISYNHARDRPLAIAIQAGLQQFAKPWYRRRALRVFRDESSLSATPGLWPTIERALDASRYFVLIASPESRQSHWVAQEVRYWLHLGRRERLLLVLSDGVLEWASDDFDWNRTTALPPVLQGVFEQEPLHVDLRWARSEAAVSRRDARLTETVASLAAPMHGRPRDALVGEDLWQHRRTLRVARSAIAVLTVLLLAALSATVVAVNQRDRAERQARIAMARLLGNESGSVGPDGIDVGLLLAAQAYAAEPDAPSSWAALAGAVTRSPSLVGYLPGSAGSTTVTAAPDGDLLAVGDEHGVVTLWRATVRERLGVAGPSLPGRVTALAFSADGRRLIAGDDAGGYAVWEAADARLVHGGALPGPVHAVGLDATGVRMAAAVGDDVVVHGRVGEPARALPDGVTTPGLLVFGSSTLTATDGQGRMVSWRLPSGERVGEEYVGLGRPFASAFSRDLGLFAAVTLGNPPYLIDVASGEDVAFDVGQAGLSIHEIAFDPSGSTLVVASPDGIALWDVATNAPKARVLTGVPGAFRDVTLHNGGAIAAAVGERGVAVWDLDAEPALVRRVEPSGTVRLDQLPNVLRGALSAGFSPDGSLLAWTAYDGTELFVAVWDPASGRERARVPGEQVISFSPEGDRIATGDFDDPGGAVVVTDLSTTASTRHPTVPWDVPTTATAETNTPRLDTPSQVDNGRGLGASIPADGVVALWDTERNREISRIPVDVQADAAMLTFDAQGRRLAVTASGGTAFLLDVDPGSWRARACALAGRGLTEQERTAFLGSVEMPDGCP